MELIVVFVQNATGRRIKEQLVVVGVVKVEKAVKSARDGIR